MSKLGVKKFAVIALSVLAITIVGVSIAAAQGPIGADVPAGSPATGPGANFVDEDGDGICDLAGIGQAGNGFRGGPGRGMGRGWVAGAAR